jgi:hypothetical protein
MERGSRIMMRLPAKTVSAPLRYAAVRTYRPVGAMMFKPFFASRLPPKVVSVQTRKVKQRRMVAGFGRPIGFGDLTDSTLQSTATTLQSDLASSGCQTTSQQDVTDFQNAWNAAGMTPALTVDGLYGSYTANALGQVMTQIYTTAQADPSTAGTTSLLVAPTGCVGAGGSGGGGSDPAAQPGANIQLGWLNIAGNPLAWAVLGGASVIGYAIWSKEGKRVKGGPRRRGKRVMRRRAAARRRRPVRRRRR